MFNDVTDYVNKTVEDFSNKSMWFHNAADFNFEVRKQVIKELKVLKTLTYRATGKAPAWFKYDEIDAIADQIINELHDYTMS
jgi:hypothetical protein